MGIIAGLNISSVQRLKVTLLEVDQKVVQKFNELEKLMDPSSSFKNYRKALAQSKTLALPYLFVIASLVCPSVDLVD